MKRQPQTVSCFSQSACIPAKGDFPISKAVTFLTKIAAFIIISVVCLCIVQPKTAFALEGDLDSDNVVGYSDVGILVSPWLGRSDAADMHIDGRIDLYDYADFAKNWNKIGSDVPVADFVSLTRAGVAPLAVQFTDKSQGTITGHGWTFGDGGTSTSTSPSHVYSDKGVYQVSLTVTGPGGTDTKTETAFVYVFTEGGSSRPVADFSAIPKEGWDLYVKPEFISLATGWITSYVWEFGDGAISTELAPNHKYADEGLYTISLTVSGPGGANKKTRTDFINIRDFNTEYVWPDYILAEPTKAAFDAAVNAIEASQVPYESFPEWCADGGHDWCEFVMKDGGGRILFGFSDQTVYINWNELAWPVTSPHKKNYFGDNMIIDGEDKNITFYYDGPMSCSQIESQDCFRIHGRDNIVRNLAWNRFPDGLHIRAGWRNMIENIKFDIICEDGSTANGGGNSCRDCTARGCTYGPSEDKAFMLGHGPWSSVMISDCHFVSDTKALRLEGEGNFVVRNCTFHGPSSQGTKFNGGHDAIIIFEGNYSNGTDAGIELGGEIGGLVRYNTFENCNAGIRGTAGSQKVRGEFNTFINCDEGVDTGGPLDMGGGMVDVFVGGGIFLPQAQFPNVAPTSSPGRNTFSGPGVSISNSIAQTAFARFNYWNYSTVAEVLANETDGVVDVDPLGIDSNDTTPPSPAPSLIAPLTVNGTSITVTCTTANDVSGPVEYYFESTNSPDTINSGWQTATGWTAAGLTANTQYTFRVKARDKSVYQNETGWSLPASATTLLPEPPPTVTVSATDPSASEDGDSGTFTISRNSGTAPVTVYYAVSGTAANGTDYQTLSGSVTLAASPSAITVTVIDDFAIEPSETVIVTLTADAAYVLGSPSSATVTIAASDVPDCQDPGWTALTCDSFEAGWGSYTASGTAAVNCNSGNHATDGSCAADIDTTGSFVHTSGLNLTSYKQLKVKFDFFASTNVGNAEGFKVEYYDGTTWQLLKNYVKDTNFTVGTQYRNVELYVFKGQYAFPAAAKIRFVCAANSSSDDIYIDNVKVMANVNASASEVELFFDDFEGGSLAAAGWTVDNSSNAKLDGAAKHGGSGSGLLIKLNSWAQKMIASSGFQNIHVKYWRKTVSFEPADNDKYYTEWSVDGTIWNTLETVTSTVDWTYADSTCVAGANNNSNYRVRLRMAGNETNDNIYIDDVKITGYQLP